MNGDLLANRTAIVTGGSSGLGRGIALALARAGAGVAVLARTRAPLERAVAEIEAGGGKALALVADVTDRNQVDAAIAAAEQSLGRVSILVNNAGRALPYGPVGIVDPHEWWRSHEISVRGALLCTSAVLPGMRARRQGCIVNVASRAGLVVGPNLSAYCVAKATVIRLTEHIDAEAKADGVRAFVVQPGTIVTEMARESLGNPDAHKWVPFLVHELEKIVDQDPEPELRRLGGQIVALATGRYDALAGAYLDLEQSTVAPIS